MKKFFLLAVITLYSLCTYSQSQLTTYALPPASLVATDAAVPLEPIVNPDYTPINYNVGKNTDFTVKVSTNLNDWKELFGYNTFTTDGRLQTRKKATFVSFDFSGTVYIEVKCNFVPSINFNNSGSLMIRPQSKNITPYYKNGNIFRFAISNPAKLSIEVNGERDRNLQIFANPINNYVPSGSNLKVYNAGIHYLSSNPANPASSGNKIYIKSGAVVIGSINAKNNDEIYIEGGGILKGNIIISSKTGIKIHGYGILDISNYKKQYSYNTSNPDLLYQYYDGIKISNSNNIEISGITINDSQQTGIIIVDSDYITINNFKMFTRVLWGDGIHMKGTSNVSINDSYIRSSDDGIAIYASRRDQNNPSYPAESYYKNRPALNISVTNSSFYTDVAHPIEIGWHGNYDSGDNGLDIYNMYFDNIDILEQDIIGDAYSGAMSINCSDGNKCDNITFRNIRIEDFSNGRLFSVNVEPGENGAATTNGKSVSYVKFENIFYNGSGETPSPIKGIDCYRFVNGVHFENFNVNGNVITKLSDYVVNNKNMIETNPFAYNITFQEGNNYSMDLPNGHYRIKSNIGISNYLRKSPQSDYISSSLSSDIWYVYRETPNTGVYRIQNLNNENYAEASSDAPSTSEPSCQERYIKTLPIANTTRQDWKIVGNGNTGYKIINSYARAYLRNSGNTITIGPANGTSSQLWQFIPVTVSSISSARTIMTEDELTTYPNPVRDILTVNAGSSTISKVVISDINGRTVLNNFFTDEQSVDIDMTGYEAGIYIATISSDTGEIIKKIIKQ